MEVLYIKLMVKDTSIQLEVKKHLSSKIVKNTYIR